MSSSNNRKERNYILLDNFLLKYIEDIIEKSSIIPDFKFILDLTNLKISTKALSFLYSTKTFIPVEVKMLDSKTVKLVFDKPYEYSSLVNNFNNYIITELEALVFGRKLLSEKKDNLIKYLEYSKDNSLISLLDYFEVYNINERTIIKQYLSDLDLDYIYRINIDARKVSFIPSIYLPLFSKNTNNVKLSNHLINFIEIYCIIKEDWKLIDNINKIYELNQVTKTIIFNVERKDMSPNEFKLVLTSSRAIYLIMIYIILKIIEQSSIFSKLNIIDFEIILNKENKNFIEYIRAFKRGYHKNVLTELYNKISNIYL